MDYSNQNQGGYQQPYQPAHKGPKKEKFNEFQGIGIVRPRSANENDPITFYPFKTEGEGGININLKITENTGTSDENGNPRQRHTTVPVSVKTNKSITAAQLKAVVSGMKVRVVGRLELQSYKSRQTGQDVTKLVVAAYVFEVLEMPMQSATAFSAPQYPPQYGQGGYAPQQQMQPAYQQQPYLQQPYQQPQYPPQYGQGYMPPQPPQQQPHQPAYAQPVPPQQGGYAPQQPAPQGVQTPPQAPPAYYQQPQGLDQMEDLPLGM